MGRSIIPVGTYPVTGDEIQLPIPDIAKPEKGNWRLEVTARELETPSPTVMQLLQAGVVIAEKSIALTNSYATYVLEISEDQQKAIVRGRCHMSELSIRICPKPPCEDCFACTECGCVEAVFPFNLTLSDGTNSTTLNNGNMPGSCTWFSSTPNGVAGCTFECNFNTVCGSDAVWTIGCPTIGGTTSVSVECDPLQITFAPIVGCDQNTYTLTITE